MRRIWLFLDSSPGPVSSLLVFIIAALALNALLNAWAPPY